MEQVYAGEWTTRYSEPSRIPYCVWEPAVPRIADKVLDCAIYIYKSVEHAECGQAVGGSGFLAAVRSEIHDGHYIYAVTNQHVVAQAGDPVIRLNNIHDQREIFRSSRHSWISHPAGDDLAALPFGLARPELIKFSFVAADSFVTQEDIAKYDIGPGDETFMVGRFVNHEGRQKNAPALRFGNIAMMPLEPIEREDGVLQDSFLVECRSIPGYSGSPVFTHIPPFAARPKSNNTLIAQSYGPWLLGVDWCHIQNRERLVARVGPDKSEEWDALANTGMAGVVPAWKLTELLHCEEFMEQRKKGDEQTSRKKSVAAQDSADDERPFDKADFERALKKASRKIEPSASDKPKK